MAMRNRSAYAIVLTLFLGIILLLLGIGFLNKRITQYRGSHQTAYQIQALSLARAGMEDARVKLWKDWDFPPEAGLSQKEFAYTEQLSPTESYTVIIDLSLRNSPFRILRIASIGTAGPMTAPLARRKLEAELDISPFLRNNPAASNPEFFEWVNWVDRGAF